MVRLLRGLLLLGVSLLLHECAVADHSDYDAVYSYNLNSSVTPCRDWIFLCSGGVYQCTNQNTYASFLVGPQPGCPSIPGADPTPPPETICSLTNNSCSFATDVPTCVSWLGSCDYTYNCATETEFNATIEEVTTCFRTRQPPSPDSICVPVNDSCEWYNPCHTWLGVCGGSYQCGTEAEYASFINGPQPLCYPPINYTVPEPDGECVYQDGQCIWSECVSWLSPCRTSWECGSRYDRQVAQAFPPPPCAAPPPQFMPPPEPAVCQISDSGTCEYQGEPECTGGQVYTSCGTQCPRTCDNYQLDFVCNSQCVPGCFCPQDTVLYSGQCINSSQCPGENPCSTMLCEPGYECLVYEETGEGYCSPNCEDLNPCRSDQECVLTTVYCFTSPCPPQLSCEDRCEGGKEWQECGTACPLSCTNYTTDFACTEQCVRGCFCPADTYIHEDECVSLTDCPDYISQCDTIRCPRGHVCVEHENSAYCDPSCRPDLLLCAEGERCQLMNQDCQNAPYCPHNFTCTQECTGGKQWSDCGTACPATCENYDVPIPCTLQCVQGCFCPPGYVDLNGVCLLSSDCSVCKGCREGEVCSAVVESNGAKYSICKGPVTVPCTDGGLTCAPGSRCVTHNVTGINYCLQSCYLQNGGCSEDQVCYYQRKEDDDDECDQLLEPCFQTTCTSMPGEVSEVLCPIGWEYTECGSSCPQTCEDHLNPRIRACTANCATNCQCPSGLVIFRDRCVDPLECYILLNGSTQLNPLPQSKDVLLVKFTLIGVSREVFDSGQFATSVMNLLLRNGLNLYVDIHAVFEEDGATVVVLKIKMEDPDQLDHIANLLMDNTNTLSNDVSSASIVSTPGETEDEDEGVSVGVVVGVVLGSSVIAVLLVMVLVVVVITVVLNRRKLKRVPVHTYEEKEKTLDTLSYASLVSKETVENDYEIS